MEGTKFLKAYIDRSTGEPIGPIDLPTSLKYVPLNRYVDFIVQCRTITEGNTIVTMAKAISDFCDYPLIEIIEGQIGEIHAQKGLDQSISGIFGYIANLCFQAKGEILDPKEAKFEVNGMEYEIPVITQQAIAGLVELPYLSVVQSIVVLEFQRLKEREIKAKGDPNGSLNRMIMDAAQNEVDQLPDDDPAKLYILKAAEKLSYKEIEKAGDPNGAQLYTLYLRMAAVLSQRVDGEDKMPFDDAEREVWINRQVVNLKKMDTQTAFNIDFFLTSILRNSDETPQIIGSLTRPLWTLASEMLLRKVPRERKQRPTAKKSSKE